MEDKSRLYGLCTKCNKGYLVKEILFEGTIFNRKKVIIFYCPYCDFTNKHTFNINENQYRKESEECG